MRYNKLQIFQAPMDGYTDYALREVLATSSLYRPNRYFTEFVNVEAVIRDIKCVPRIFEYSENQRPISAQLFGKNPDSFYHASKIVIGLGFDGIDVNIGCPAKNIAGKNEGAGLIKNKELSEQIIDACKKSIVESKKKIILSVKTRLGYEKDTAEEWIGFLDDKDLDFITIHGRTFKQGYSGKANWDRIGEIAKTCKTPVVGNGDIENIKQANDYQKKYDLYATMIGRNFTSFFDNKIEACINYLDIHEKFLMKYFRDEKFSINSTKKVQLLFIKGVEDSKDLKRFLLNSEKYKESISALEKYQNLTL